MDVRKTRLINMNKLILESGSQKKFCDKTGIESSYISQIKNPSNPKNIGEKMARRIEEAFDIDRGWMDGTHQKEEANNNIQDKQSEEKTRENTGVYDAGLANDITHNAKIPLISWVSAGTWCEAIDNYTTGDAEQWLPCPVRCGRYTYALRVEGDSMTSVIPGAKSYPEGSIIYVDPECQLTNGRRVIAKLADKNEVTFKTYKEDAGEKWLMPINPQYEKILIDQNVTICGVIIAKYEPE